MRLEARHGGDQRADPGGDTDRDHQDVVHNQRRGGEQGDAPSEIFARHGVRSTSAGIRGDGLEVRDVDNDQERNDAEADGHDILNSERAERNQQSECGFGAVSRGTERIQSEDADSG